LVTSNKLHFPLLFELHNHALKRREERAEVTDQDGWMIGFAISGVSSPKSIN